MIKAINELVDGFSPARHQAVILANLYIALESNFVDTQNDILFSSLKKMYLKCPLQKSRPFSDFNVLNITGFYADILLIKDPCCQMSFITVNILFTWSSMKSAYQNVHRFADDIFKSIFLNENVWISINVSLNFVPKC